MRVALLLSGKFRGSYIPFNYLEKNLISKYNPDIFINYNYKNEDDMECDENELVSIYNPKLIFWIFNFKRFRVFSALVYAFSVTHTNC